MKIAFGMIVFEGDYVLRQCLEQVYPFASQILISEGPVSYWQKQGRKTSTDRTNHILDVVPDPENKITIVHGQFSEKDEQCKAYMKYINDDIDYLWNLDSDEVYKTEDIKKIVSLLEQVKPTSVGIRSCSFYGGFDHYLTGFELNKDNFLRIFRVVPGCNWATHRPPTIMYPYHIDKLHIDSNWLWDNLGIQMYHYSYVFPRQVFTKVSYYKSDVSKENCIDNYYQFVYLPWVNGDENDRNNIESKYLGVHEFKPHVRGDCYTTKFESEHPESIQRDMGELLKEFKNQLNKYVY
jgi:hypothetical protein